MLVKSLPSRQITLISPQTHGFKENEISDLLRATIKRQETWLKGRSARFLSFSYKKMIKEKAIMSAESFALSLRTCRHAFSFIFLKENGKFKRKRASCASALRDEAHLLSSSNFLPHASFFLKKKDKKKKKKRGSDRLSFLYCGRSADPRRSFFFLSVWTRVDRSSRPGGEHERLVWWPLS